MTYCVGLCLKDGLVLVSDTRTNAGVDHISVFKKTHIFCEPGERFIALMTAGNLAISQAVMSLLEESIGNAANGVGGESLMTVPSMFKAAQLVGQAVRTVYATDGPALASHGLGFDVAIILAGQIEDRDARLFLVYSAGNFIEATPDTPFLQIGEHKYGKPVLDRSCTYETDLYDGLKLGLISMDATLRSNLTVGMPIDVTVYRRDALQAELHRRLDDRDEYLHLVREEWSSALREAFREIPPPSWPRHG